MTESTSDTKPYVFWYHFNKNAWRQRHAISWTVHWRGVCYIVDTINCGVPTHSCERTTQPVAVIKGKARRLEIREAEGKIEAILT